MLTLTRLSVVSSYSMFIVLEQNVKMVIIHLQFDEYSMSMWQATAISDNNFLTIVKSSFFHNFLISTLHFRSLPGWQL